MSTMSSKFVKDYIIGINYFKVAIFYSCDI